MIKNKLLLLGITVPMLLLSADAAAQHPHDGHYRPDTTALKRTQRLDEVVVRGKYVDRVNKSAYNAVAIDTRKLRNTNLDLAHALDRVTGIKIREEGGVGSAVQLNLNGFTGQHVKVFIDGMPMDNSNTSFRLNNIPAGFASQLQVYKGVVPVDFGGDAIGGIINIVTDHSPRTYVDASYSYGSFNTHRSNIALGWTGKRGFVIRFNAYRNYSDNDYKVKTQWTDLTYSTISNEEGWFRRFHDRYHNEAVVLQAGLVNKSWANKLLFGLQYTHEYAQVQNANLMKIVFGGKLRKNWGLTPSLLYEKRNLFTRGLNLRLSARYDYTSTNNVDTLSRTYSWTGQWIPKASQGEGATSLAEFTGKTLTAVANLTYRIGDQHFFTLNETYINFHRHTTDNSANRAMTSAATFMRRINIKDITGLSYQFIPNTKWNATAFVKCVPNLPYAFGNMDASYTMKHVFGKYNKLTIGYDMRYVHRFYRSWSGDGAKLYVPEQYSHDANLTYSIYGGRYNISIEANNFTNSLLYDNYSLQKPGRNFAIKFRYSWSK